jgi:hypothetical protein
VTYDAVEGLGNRLRIHLVAHAYALHTSRKLLLDWKIVKAFGVRFSDLFELNGFQELDGSLWQSALVRLYQKHSFKRLNGLGHLSEDQTVEDLPHYRARLVQFGEAFWPTGCDNGGAVLGRYSDRVFQSLTPRRRILEKIGFYHSQFSPVMVGIHVRRGDFWISFPEKIVPVERYAQLARVILRIIPAARFFVATDDPHEAKPLLEEFPCVIQKKEPREVDSDPMEVFKYPNKCNRDTKAGAVEALVDLLLLSRTQLILGAPHSTFSVLASLMGKTKLLYPTRDSCTRDKMEETLAEMLQRI